MGFAASQARFLSLTARLTNNEFEAQQISQQRLALADEMEVLSDKYQAATSNEVYVASVLNGEVQSKVTLSYDVIIGEEGKGGLGMKLVTSSGKIVVRSEAEMNSEIEASKGTKEPLSELDFLVFESINDTDTLQANLEEGNMFIVPPQKSEITGDWDFKTPEQLFSVSKVYDTTDDAAAQAEWVSKSKKIEKLDSALELKLQQLEADHKAIETEMDSVQKVIDDNIEGSYKTFG